MERRTIIVLVAAISVALLGSVWVQAKWVRDTLALKDAQYSESIDNALVAVSERLERAEARRILSHLPTGEPQAPMLIEGAGEGALAEGAGPLSDHSLDELLRGFLTTGMFKDIRERVDPQLLDSLLKEELRLRHIGTAPAYGIFNAEGQAALLHARQAGDSLRLRSSEHRTRLYRNDWPQEQAGKEDAWWLHLHAPARPSVLLRSMWPMVAASSVFLLLIAVTFGYTLHIILRQKRLGDIQNDLVNNLTHELKTPISTISLACEALNDPGIPKDPAQVRQFTDMIRDENKRLGMLVESVLLSAVSGQGGMRLRLTDVDMHALLAEVVRNSALLAEKRGGRITLKPNAELAHVRGDRTFLTSIFYNLIDNAVKYCQAAPRVQLVTRSDAQALTIEVRDNGIGIPRQEQRKIFDNLYRVPTGNVHNVKGFGMGLSYVRSVVERHGGTIRVESNADGYEQATGSRFIVTLPFEHGEENEGAVVRG